MWKYSLPFTTTKAHITLRQGIVEQLIIDEGLISQSELPFKGNMDIKKLEECINKYGPEKISFVRRNKFNWRTTIFFGKLKRS